MHYLGELIISEVHVILFHYMCRSSGNANPREMSSAFTGISTEVIN